MSQFNRQQSLIGLIGWLALSFAVAGVGAIASLDAAEFYQLLERPFWAPPGGVFAPVWTLLFALMGVAAWLVWRRAGFAGARVALVLFLVQLFFNGLWSWLFFAWHRGALAFADVLLLWALIVLTLVAFWRVRPLAGMLLIPYLLWVTLALALNFSVWRLNPGLLGG